jgi:hypothetical protein
MQKKALVLAAFILASIIHAPYSYSADLKTTYIECRTFLNQGSPNRSFPMYIIRTGEKIESGTTWIYFDKYQNDKLTYLGAQQFEASVPKEWGTHQYEVLGDEPVLLTVDLDETIHTGRSDYNPGKLTGKIEDQEFDQLDVACQEFDKR